MATIQRCTRSGKRAPIPALALLTLAPLFGAAACSSTPESDGAAAATESMEAFNLSTVKVRDGIDQTIASLNTLVGSSGEEVKASFAAFKKNLADLEKNAEVVREEAAEMKSRGDAYFKDWEAGSSGMSTERHDELAKAYLTIKQDMTKAKDQFQPFLASLKDVQGYLGLDLTAQGLQGAAPLAKTATTQGGELKGSIEAVLQQVNSVRGMISAGKK